MSFDVDDFHIRWFANGELNASVNCLDRHLSARGDKTALIFELDDPNGTTQRISYRDLHARVCKLANALRNLGVAKGDRVTIYLPMIPEAVVAMLACARIGAVHMVVFGGFAPQSIADRVSDCSSKASLAPVTARMPTCFRGGLHRHPGWSVGAPPGTRAAMPV